MRTLVILPACAILLAACGSSSSSSTTALFGGASLSSSSVDAEFATASTTNCSIDFEGTSVPFDISALKIDFTSWASACSDYEGFPACAVHSGGQSVTVILVTLGATAVPLATGTYTVTDSPSASPVLNASGDTVDYYVVAYAEALSTETSSGCQTLQAPSSSTGTIVLTSVTSTSVSGTASLTFQGGYTVSGSFTAPVCATGNTVLSGSLCSLAQSFASTFQSTSGPTTVPFCTEPTACSGT